MAEGCPILGRLIHEFKKNQVVGQMFYDVYATLDGYREGDRGGNSRKVQLARAFYCIDVLRWETVGQIRFSPEGELESRPLPRTREGLNLLIAEAERVEKSSVVENMEASFAASEGNAPVDAALHTRRLQNQAEQCLLVIEACEFLRPRLRNGKSLERMGHYLATVLTMRSSETVIKHAKNLSNITEAHAFPWTP